MPRELEGRLCTPGSFLMPWDIGLTMFWIEEHHDVFLEYNRPLKLHLGLHLIIQHRIFTVNYQREASAATYTQRKYA